MTEITKATFEKEGKIDGQLTLKEKKFLRDNITSLHEGRASKANAPYYLVEPSQDI
ncbi:MAG: hypothetical protein LBG59_06840 [Candidatus Peribacteria bacterium]|jgi:hypothetical protein|nr:hypothetical protein [Candidatus Peribacteria bacterium]